MLIEDEVNGCRYGYGNGYLFLRDLSTGSVLTALYSPRKERAIAAIITGLSGFSDKWSALNQVKGINVEYRAN